MKGSFQALLADVIDYAGLFPPVLLPLPEALHQYLRHRTEPEAWMLARFVCPAQRLDELDLSEDLQAKTPLRLAILGRGAETPEQFIQYLEEDIQAVQSFQRTQGERAVVETYEVQLPPDAVNLLETLARRLAAAEFGKIMVFCEFAPGNHKQESLTEMIHGLAARNQAEPLRGRWGFKLRTGGLEASAFPSSEQVAQVVAACRDAEVCWKATAGLHWPFRRFDATLGTWTHGFVNLLAAAVLGYTHGLKPEEIRLILEEKVLGYFLFSEDAMVYYEWRIDKEQIVRARHQSLISFGSCSFDEPCSRVIFNRVTEDTKKKKKKRN